MNPAARLAAALVVALVLWLPSLTACLRGDIGVPTAALRYLVAYILVRAGLGVIGRLYDSYAVEAASRSRNS